MKKIVLVISILIFMKSIAVGQQVVKKSIGFDKFIKKSQQPLSFREVTLNEVKQVNPNVSDTTTLILKNGKRISVVEYLKQFNALEQKLNSIGATVRLGLDNETVAELQKVKPTLIIKNNFKKEPQVEKNKSNNKLNNSIKFSVDDTTAYLYNSQKFSPLNNQKKTLGVIPPMKHLQMAKTASNYPDHLSTIQYPLFEQSLQNKINSELPSLIDINYPKLTGRIKLDQPDSLPFSESDFERYHSYYKMDYELKVSVAVPIFGFDGMIDLLDLNAHFKAFQNKSSDHQYSYYISVMGDEIANSGSNGTMQTTSSDIKRIDVDEDISLTKALGAPDDIEIFPGIKCPIRIKLSDTRIGGKISARLSRSGLRATIAPTIASSIVATGSIGIDDIAEAGIEGVLNLLKFSPTIAGKTELLKQEGTQGQYLLINETSRAMEFEAFSGRVYGFIEYFDILKMRTVRKTVNLFRSDPIVEFTSEYERNSNNKEFTWRSVFQPK